MTPMRWLYAAFWIFIGAILLFQFNNYNTSLDKAQVKAGPQQQHFYFHPSHHLLGSVVNPPGADVRQVGNSVENNTPYAGNFTYHVTLKNQGSKKAVNVQIAVYPFKGIVLGNPDRGGPVQNISDSDPYVQTSQTISFPDLAPGESATRDTVFPSVPGYVPGDNPNPPITFQTDKSSATSASPTP